MRLTKKNLYNYNFTLIMPVMSRIRLVILQLRINSNKAFSKLNNLDVAINHFFKSIHVFSGCRSERRNESPKVLTTKVPLLDGKGAGLFLFSYGKSVTLK